MPSMTPAAAGSGTMSPAVATSSSGNPLFPSPSLYPRATLFPSSANSGMSTALAAAGSLTPA